MLDGLDREEFLHDRKTQRAVGMCFVTLGNAFHDLKIASPKLAGRFSELDDNVDLRNVLAHEYRSVKPATVWQVARDHLPDLEHSVASLISELDPEGRHTLESLYSEADERADRELQLASVLTARVHPSDQFHWGAAAALTRLFDTVEGAEDPPDDKVGERANAVARARAETELRVDVTNALGGLPRDEYRARFAGHPGFDRQDKLEAYDTTIRERMDALARTEVSPNDLERFVAKAVVVAVGTRHEALARSLEAALGKGIVPDANDIRAGRRALIAEFSDRQDVTKLSLPERDRKLERIYSHFTVVEIRRICAGHGPFLNGLLNRSGFPSVVETFKNLHAKDHPGPAPWHRLHADVVRTMNPERQQEQRRKDMELQLVCALTERIATSGDDDQFHRNLGEPVRDALAAAGKTVGVSQTAVDDLAAQIARARAETDLRVDLTREFSRLPLHEARARFEGHPRFSRGDIRKPYNAAIKEKMKELDRKRVIPNDLEQVVARAVVVSEGTRNADTAQKMAKALHFGTVLAAEKIRAEQQALLAEMAQPREDDTDQEKIKLAQRLYRCLTFVEICQICDGRGPHLKTLKSVADRAQVSRNFKALHSFLIVGPAPWLGVHREVALTLGMGTEGAERSGRFPTASM